uniref:PPUP9740 n=1 Tax=Poeciliopsis prolifica TaxID=188132 RepID=A0A0S7EIU6_9TELE
MKIFFLFVLNNQRLKRMADNNRIVCSAGKFLNYHDNKCEHCPEGFYTERSNQEPSCHSCFRDCIPKYHLKEVQSCTSKTPLKCECESGYRCIDMDPKGNCKQCEENEPPPATVGKDRQTTSPQDKPCSSSRCRSPAPTPANPKAGHTSAELAAIFGPGGLHRMCGPYDHVLHLSGPG